MSDTKNPGDTLTVAPPKTLTPKRPSGQPDTVRQSFSHGRSKTVVVETVKRRPATTTPSPQAAPVSPPKPRPVADPPAVPVASERPAPAKAASAETAKSPRRTAAGVVLRTLSDDEKEARTRALADSKLREAEERERALEEAKQRAAEDSRREAERQAAEARAGAVDRTRVQVG